MTTKFIKIFFILLLYIMGIVALPQNIFAGNDIYSLIGELRKSTIMIYYNNEKGYAIPLGSGFVAASDGLVVTANHVVRKEGDQGISIERDKDGNMTRAEVAYLENIYCKYPDDKTYKLAVLSDKELLKKRNNSFIYDYAILKIVDSPKGLSYLDLGDYSMAQVGDNVLFAGFPFAKPNFTVHRGMLSAKYSDYSFGDKKMLANLLQIDGSVNKGNSGGPVVDIKTKKVIGIINTRYVGITDKLNELRKTIEMNAGSGSVKLFGVDPNITLLELINSLDWTISVGIGQAISINYIREEIDLIKKNNEIGVQQKNRGDRE